MGQRYAQPAYGLGLPGFDNVVANPQVDYQILQKQLLERLQPRGGGYPLTASQMNEPGPVAAGLALAQNQKLRPMELRDKAFTDPLTEGAGRKTTGEVELGASEAETVTRGLPEDVYQQVRQRIEEGTPASNLQKKVLEQLMARQGRQAEMPWFAKADLSPMMAMADLLQPNIKSRYVSQMYQPPKDVGAAQLPYVMQGLQNLTASENARMKMLLQDQILTKQQAKAGVGRVAQEGTAGRSGVGGLTLAQQGVQDARIAREQRATGKEVREVLNPDQSTRLLKAMRGIAGLAQKYEMDDMPGVGVLGSMVPTIGYNIAGYFSDSQRERNYDADQLRRYTEDIQATYTKIVSGAQASDKEVARLAAIIGNRAGTSEKEFRRAVQDFIGIIGDALYFKEGTLSDKGKALLQEQIKRGKAPNSENFFDLKGKIHTPQDPPKKLEDPSKQEIPPGGPEAPFGSEPIENSFEKARQRRKQK